MSYFDTLALLEPRLGALLSEALGAAPADHAAPWCAHHAFYDWPGGFKARLSALVGQSAAPNAPAMLHTASAYDAAYRRILYALPPCRPGCACGEGDERGAA